MILQTEATPKVRGDLAVHPSYVGGCEGMKECTESKFWYGYVRTRTGVTGRSPTGRPLTLLVCKAAIRAVCSSLTTLPVSTVYGMVPADTPGLSPQAKHTGAHETGSSADAAADGSTVEERHTALFDYSNDVARCTSCTSTQSDTREK